MKPCLYCDGKGYIEYGPHQQFDPIEHEICPDCDGQGLVFESAEEQRLYEVLMT